MLDVNVWSGTILIAFAALAGGIGNAWVVSRYLEGVTRQPEAAGMLRTGMFLGVALVEALPILCMVFGVMKLLGVLNK